MKFQRRPPLQRAKQRGITLVEMGMTLLITGGALLGCFALYQKINRDIVLDQARKDITTIVNGMNKTMLGTTNTVNMSTQIMSTMNIWPKERVTDAGKSTVVVAGPFPGSTEQVFGYANGHGPRLPQGWQSFNYWIENVPQEYCADVVLMLAAQNAVVNIGVGSMSGTLVRSYTTEPDPNDPSKTVSVPHDTLTAVPANNANAAGRRWVMSAYNLYSDVNMATVNTACSEEPAGSTNNKRQISAIVLRGAPV